MMNIRIPIIVSLVHITVWSAIVFIVSLIIPGLAHAIGAATFVYAYLPLPILVVWSYKFGETQKIIGSMISISVGLFFTFLILDFTTPAMIETIGETTIIRHAGPSLEQAYSFDSYLFPLLVMGVVIKLYWHTVKKEFGKQKVNNTLESTHEDA